MNYSPNKSLLQPPLCFNCFYLKWKRNKNPVKIEILHRTGFILPERRQCFMPSSLQTCLCSWLEPAQRVVGKRMFVFWGQCYTCARTLVCPLAFWRKESSSPSMSVLFQRCLLSKQSRWSYARGTRHKEKEKKNATLCAVSLKNIFSGFVNFCISISHHSFYGSTCPLWVTVIVCLFLRC